MEGKTIRVEEAGRRGGEGGVGGWKFVGRAHDKGDGQCEGGDRGYC